MAYDKANASARKNKKAEKRKWTEEHRTTQPAVFVGNPVKQRKGNQYKYECAYEGRREIWSNRSAI